MNIKYIRASAGSGKTYQLSSQYIGILLRGIQTNGAVDPGVILATTFTRAAAGEILERVLARLARAVLDENEREMLRKNEKLDTLSKADCSRALSMLSASLHRVGIGTIDSFFARVARSMSDDLGLANDWRIVSETDAREISARVLDRMLNMPEGTRLRELWTIWKKFRPGIRMGEGLLDTMEAVRFLALEPNDAPPECREPRRLEKKEAEALRALIAGIEVPRNSDGKPNAPFRKALDALADEFIPGTRLDDFLQSKGFLGKLLKGAESFSGKPIPPALLQGLQPFIDRVRAFQRELFTARCEAIREMQARYAPLRDTAARSAGLLTFREIEETVRRGIDAGDWDDGTAASDIYFRLDGRIDHLLFDEFQDTSWSQFEFFRPVIENLSAEAGRSVFVVGDAKQAIYGWRGGDREVIDSFPDTFAGIEMDSLTKSFRSSPAVLEAVDTVFQNMDSLPGFEEPFGDAAHAWLGEDGLRCREHGAHRKNLRGRVRLWCVDGIQSRSEGDPDAAFVEAMTTRVAALLAEDAPAEIAVLLRRNKYIPRIIDELRKKGIDASAGSSGSPVTDSFAVEVILAALTWLDHPGNTAARRLAAHAPWAADLESGASQRIHAEWNRIWYHAGPGALVGAWVRDPEFVAHLSGHDRLRCNQLLALARKFEDAGGRPGELVQMARAERRAAGGRATVRVMTVHAAKGLEFEAVVLGDLSAARGGGMGQPRFIRQEGLDRLLPSSKGEAAILDMETLFKKGTQKEIMESLSLLYVGMTRAKCFLDIVVPPKGKSAKSFSPALLLNAVLNITDAAGLEQPAWQNFHDGRPLRELEEKPGMQPAGDPAFDASETGGPVAAPHRFEQKSPSAQEGGGEISVESLFRTGSVAAMAMGTAVHAWLSQIDWITGAGLEKSAEEILAATMRDWRGISEADARRNLADILTKLLAPGSELRSAFDRERYARQWKVASDQVEAWRERSFAVVHGGAIWSGRFDRVVIARNAKGEVIAAEVVDFKTDREEKPDYYQPQLDSYRDVLGRMFAKQTARPAIATRLIYTSRR